MVTGNMRPALSIDLGVHQAGQAGAVGGGGHRQQPQLGAQHALQVEAERQAEVGFQRALVDFVQDHRGDAVQAGIGLQAADQQALGDDLDAGFGGAGAVQAGAEADGAADRLVQQQGHAGGGGAGGEAARLQHQDPAVAAPGGVKQGERHEGGLAGAGRGDQHGVAAGVQRGLQGGERVGDGKIGHDGGLIERNRAKQARRGASPLDPIKGLAFEIHSLRFEDEGGATLQSRHRCRPVHWVQAPCSSCIHTLGTLRVEGGPSLVRLSWPCVFRPNAGPGGDFPRQGG